MEEHDLYPEASREIAEAKGRLAMDNLKAWRKFSRTVFSDGAIPEKTKHLIAIAVAHTTQCPYCIRHHTKVALQMGVSKEEIMESIWVAAEMRAGAAYSHGNLAMDEILKYENETNN